MRSFGPAIRIEAGALTCGSCGHRLGTLEGGYEAGARVVAVASGTLGPQVAEDGRLALLLHLCPQCGTCLKAVTNREGEDQLADVRDLEPAAEASR